MKVYLDSSALVKRALGEPESLALRRALEAHSARDDLLVSSVLTSVEVSRSIRSRTADASPAEVVELIEVALSGMLEMPITEQVISLARRLGPSSLRSLDAIHLASATLFGADVVCAYDARMLTSASELGFATSSPT